jgi:hypothetical protein
LHDTSCGVYIPLAVGVDPSRRRSSGFLENEGKNS